VYSALLFDEQRDRSGLEKNRLLITFNYQLTLMEMKAEIRDRIMSHDKPVIAALYNSTYNQVIPVRILGKVKVFLNLFILTLFKN